MQGRTEVLDRKIGRINANYGQDWKKTIDDVFDEVTLKNLQQLISQGIISTIENVIATGKEGNVFRARTIRGENRAVKIYRINTATFRKLEKYIEGDTRFKNSGNSPRERIFTWAQKEYKNLHSMRAAGANVPKPYHVHKNIVVMQYLGWRFRPYPTIRELPPEEPEKFLLMLKESIKSYRNQKLSHGDLSEYNIINRREEPFIIDVGQAVPDSHPLYSQLHERDMKNLHRFWKKYIPNIKKEEFQI
ncbi:MAG: serine protein kinase RIO [Candidatus Poseidoniia archaeon]|nr:serine protein kinase RIO [Candidatus Poseidoniia archaeon]